MIKCKQKCNFKHCKKNKFKNHELEYKSTFKDFLSNVWALFTDKTENKVPLKGEIPVQKITKKDLLKLEDNSVVRLAHSTLLIKIDNKFILTDPVFSEKITPFAFIAPKRFHDIPIQIEDLPFIDIVIISHNHYDHLDKPSIEKLKNKVGHFYTTVGIQKVLIKFGVETLKITELDWWQSYTTNSIKITATPAQHFSGRGLFDADKTLWASWVIKSSKTNLFFSGDTGYFKTFKEIGEKYGPFDMTFLETGAYNIRWKDIHMMPNQTAQAHIDLKGSRLFPIHNSTFKLSLHSWNDPLNKISQEAQKLNIFLCHPKMGQTVSILNKTTTEKWW